MTSKIESEKTRVILFHKHPMSANLHFVYFPYGGVSGFSKLPTLSSIVEENDDTSENYLAMHPALINAWAEQQLDLSAGSLQIEPEFNEVVEIPSGYINVFLAGFTQYPELEKAQSKHDVELLNLLQCIGIAPVEMLLLQKAYRVIMGG